MDLSDRYRKENATPDLFGYNSGKPFVGVNRQYPTYADADDFAGRALRSEIVGRYATRQENIGQIPNDAFFHAETTLLLRAARDNGGTLEGKSFTVLVDYRMCFSCERWLPKIGLHLGNPTVTFVAPNGKSRTMHDGVWTEVKEKP